MIHLETYLWSLLSHFSTNRTTGLQIMFTNKICICYHSQSLTSKYLALKFIVFDKKHSISLFTHFLRILKVENYCFPIKKIYNELKEVCYDFLSKNVYKKKMENETTS